MRVLVTGGGTGGHFYPALTVMKKLQRENQKHQICYLGTGRGLESGVAPRYDWIDFRTVTVTGLSRGNFWGFLKGLIFLPLGLIQTLLVFWDFKPEIVYGTGGYTTFPPAFWGILLRIPVVTHELNIKPGITNRILSRFVTKVLLSYPDTKQFLPRGDTEVTGTPVREKIRRGESPSTPEDFGLNPDSPIILLFGGSRGSRNLVEKVFRELEKIERPGEIPFQLLIQTGQNNYSSFKERIEALPEARVSLVDYIEDMGGAYSMSDLVICRGGAGTMAELVATSTPGIIVPWKGAAENHQYFNGKFLERNGVAVLVEETNWKEYPLFEKVTGLLSSPDGLKEMARNYRTIEAGNGANKVVTTLKDTITEGE